MNHGPVLFFGALLTLAASFCGLVFGSFHQLGRQMPEVDELTGAIYPFPMPGASAQGERIYQQNGCAACHTEQVKIDSYNADLKRGWGERRTVSRDLLYSSAAPLGHLRIGPDLADIGSRDSSRFAAAWESKVNPAETNGATPEQIDAELKRVATDRYYEKVEWHLLHLYNPQIASPGSLMPAYKFLFEKRPVGRTPSKNALKLPAAYATPGYEVVPRDEAYSLVAYLMDLKKRNPLFESPLPKAPGVRKAKQPESAGTNAPAPAAAPETK